MTLCILSSNMVFFGDYFSSFPYLYCHLVVLFLLMLQHDGVFPSLVLCSAPCLHAIIQWHSSILLFTFFSCLVGISFSYCFLIAFYGFPSLVCLLLGGIICPYVCCSCCSMVHSPPLVVLILVALFMMLLLIMCLNTPLLVACYYLVFCVFFLNALFLIFPHSTLFYAICCYIL